MPGKRGPSKVTLQKRANAANVSETDIATVFDFWVATFQKKRAVMDEKRKTVIGSAIHYYGLDTCMDAIRGCSISDFHMGRNSRNKKYNDIELILRDAQHVEKFCEIWESAGGGGTTGGDPW